MSCFFSRSRPNLFSAVVPRCRPRCTTELIQDYTEDTQPTNFPCVRLTPKVVMLTLHQSCFAHLSFEPRTFPCSIHSSPSLSMLPVRASKYTIFFSEIIDSIAGIVHSQISQAERNDFKSVFTYDILVDVSHCFQHATKQEIHAFIRTIFEKCQLEYECLVMALIYLDRMQNNTGFRLEDRNWRSSLLLCLMEASKMSDDFSMSNDSFAYTAELKLSYVNILEGVVLKMLDYSLNISPAEYAAYHNAVRAIAVENRKSRAREVMKAPSPNSSPIAFPKHKSKIWDGHYISPDNSPINVCCKRF